MHSIPHILCTIAAVTFLAAVAILPFLSKIWALNAASLSVSLLACLLVPWTFVNVGDPNFLILMVSLISLSIVNPTGWIYLVYPGSLGTIGGYHLIAFVISAPYFFLIEKLFYCLMKTKDVDLGDYETFHATCTRHMKYVLKYGKGFGGGEPPQYELIFDIRDSVDKVNALV